MNYFRKLVLGGVFFFITSVCAQITGVVTDEKGERLPYVSIYIEGSSLGTTTNDDGTYMLTVKNRENISVVFQFLGYKTVKKEVTLKAPFHLNITLYPEKIVLDEVKISSKENLANVIVKKAIATKQKNTSHLKDFTADFYSKGVFRVKNAPEKILGQKLNFPFPLDSTRSGIIYLSETISKIKSKKNPKKFKELIVASKISGENNGVSFNRAEEVNFDLYQNIIDVNNKNVISPLANGAFGYYRYKLFGTFYDVNGNLINKVKIIPKQKDGFVFSGFIYIVENTWALYGAELTINGSQLNNPLIKNLYIKQNYKYSQDEKAWNLILQTIEFKAGIFDFNFSGSFSASYSNYNLKPNFKKQMFTNEILSFEKNATQKDTTYWNKVRPIPLTMSEKKDYEIKDSLKVIVKSKTYLDSIDAKSNPFSIFSPLLGYTYRNSYKKWEFTYESPLSSLGFNTVQGFHTNAKFSFFKRLNDFGKSYKIISITNYSLGEKIWRSKLGFQYKWDNITIPELHVSGGFEVSQYNPNNSISEFYNILHVIFTKKSYMKLYQRKFANVSFSKDVFNGVRFTSLFEYSRRNPLETLEKFKELDDLESDYQVTSFSKDLFDEHSIFKVQLDAKIQLGNKFISFPSKKVNVGNKIIPVLHLSYRKMFGAKDTRLNSDLVTAKLEKDLNLGAFGFLRYQIQGGMFLKKKSIAFPDYLHPNGNQFYVLNLNQLNRFHILDFYALSTNDKQAEFHLSHNFKGFVLGRIPLINWLKFYLTTDVKVLSTANKKPYFEYSVGLDNIGFGNWRFLSVKYVRSNFGTMIDNRFVFGITLFD